MSDDLLARGSRELATNLLDLQLGEEGGWRDEGGGEADKERVGRRGSRRGGQGQGGGWRGPRRDYQKTHRLYPHNH